MIQQVCRSAGDPKLSESVKCQTKGAEIGKLTKGYARGQTATHDILSEQGENHSNDYEKLMSPKQSAISQKLGLKLAEKDVLQRLI